MSRPLTGERIGILGLARSGIAAARLALARGASVYASDAGASAAAQAAAEEVRALGGEVDVGRHDMEKLAACDRIVLSPGIPPTAPIMQDPVLRRVPVVPELEFGFEQLGVPVIGVTGTNGKTTVTALATHLLCASGYTAVAGGNIGTALSDVALRDPLPDVVVVEASSFQLGKARAFAPEIGVLTNLAPDHLDWYSTVEEYYADKARLFQNATPESRWVLNAEDALARDLPGEAPGTRYHFAIEGPLAEGERGGYLSGDGWLVLRLEPGREERLLPAAYLRILRPHNVANALAASLAARLFGASPEGIAAGLRTFASLPNRMEPVAEREGVLWINDSKATNVASTRVALRSLQRPTILLLGGRHKGEPYTELVEDMGRVRCVIAYGEAGERIRNDLTGKVPVEQVAGSFQEVLRRAARLASPGDAVLLSPACSSFDMFANYEERGKRFRELVQEGFAG